MKKGFLFLLALFTVMPLSSLAANFVVCKSTYALCTKALCEPIPGKADMATCKCDVKTGYSAGEKPCQEVTETNEGKQIASRYYPIKGYVVCSNDRPWTWCLDSPCIVDKNNPNKASCMCSIVKNKGDYIIVTDKNSKTACTKGLYSSATLSGATELTEFLKTQPDLKPFPITVYKNQ